MNNVAENHVRKFYTTGGWNEDGGVTEDARMFEDLRPCASEYVSKCRLRVLDHIPASGINLLDMASGPIQYPEYLEYSRAFEKRYCVDLSSQALESAERKLGNRGVYLCGSFFDMELDSNSFDCAISLHTIYHMDRDLQKQAVRKLIRVCKPGSPLVVVYSNPGALLPKLTRLLRGPQAINNVSIENGLYFFAHPLTWWNKFSDEAEVRFYPWRSFRSAHQERLIPGNRFGRALFKLLFATENLLPWLFVRYFEYPIVVLTKK
jgi:ubiquinone/menaquinone biosynthesis C-methylase UbiE